MNQFMSVFAYICFFFSLIGKIAFIVKDQISVAILCAIVSAVSLFMSHKFKKYAEDSNSDKERDWRHLPGEPRP